MATENSPTNQSTSIIQPIAGSFGAQPHNAHLAVGVVAPVKPAGIPQDLWDIAVAINPNNPIAAARWTYIQERIQDGSFDPNRHLDNGNKNTGPAQLADGGMYAKSNPADSMAWLNGGDSSGSGNVGRSNMTAEMSLEKMLNGASSQAETSLFNDRDMIGTKRQEFRNVLAKAQKDFKDPAVANVAVAAAISLREALPNTNLEHRYETVEKTLTEHPELQKQLGAAFNSHDTNAQTAALGSLYKEMPLPGQVTQQMREHMAAHAIQIDGRVSAIAAGLAHGYQMQDQKPAHAMTGVTPRHGNLHDLKLKTSQLPTAAPALPVSPAVAAVSTHQSPRSRVAQMMGTPASGA